MASLMRPTYSSSSLSNFGIFIISLSSDSRFSSWISMVSSAPLSFPCRIDFSLLS